MEGREPGLNLSMLTPKKVILSARKDHPLWPGAALDILYHNQLANQLTKRSKFRKVKRRKTHSPMAKYPPSPRSLSR